MKKLLITLFFTLTLIACNNEEKNPVVTAISLDKSELTLKVGDKYQFKASHVPAEAKAPTYEWIISEYFNKCGTITQDGLFTAERVGNSTVTIYTQDIFDQSGFKFMSDCRITIEPVQIESLKLNKNSLNLDIEKTELLSFTIEPEHATLENITWTSSNSKIVTVNKDESTKNGAVIKAIKPGEAEITVTVNNTIKDVCKVVVNPIKLQDLQINAQTREVAAGKTCELLPIYIPEDATNKNITWSSSDETIAYMKYGGIGIVQAVKPGSCTIKIVSEDGGLEAECKLTVIPAPVESIQFDNYQYKIEIGGEKQLNVNVFPENAGNKNIKWSSSNTIIAPIDEKGIVKGNSTGSATITAESEDGGKQATCQIIVAEINEFIELYFPSASVSIINGYLTGTIYSGIINNSSRTIKLTKFKVLDSNTWNAVAETTDGALLGDLAPKGTTNLGGRFVSVYEPIFIWEFTYNGVSYQVRKQYGKDSPFSTKVESKGKADTMVKLNTK